MLVYDTCHLTNNKYIIQYYKHKRHFKLLLLLPNFLFVFEKNQQIKKNNKNPKNYVIDVFASFSVSSQKDSNFKCLFNVFDF